MYINFKNNYTENYEKRLCRAQMIMNILWINETSSLLGGCEHYIVQTVDQLKQQNIRSTLLYNPLLQSEVKFLNFFDAAYPLVDLNLQLKTIPYDLAFVHQVYNDEILKIISSSNKPVIRYLHDHQLFCLRGSKLAIFSNEPCNCDVPGFECYPLGATINRVAGFPGFKIETLSHIKHKQDQNRCLDGFIVGSNFMKSITQSNGFNANDVHVIPPFVPEAKSNHVQREGNLILFVGQLVRGKGLDVLLEALKLLPPTYRLIVAGTGRQEKSYHSLTRKLGLQNQVLFLGRIDQDQISELYQKATCVAMPSRWPEPFGLVGPEAMRFGTPVIASNIGGIPEWLQDNITGILVPYNNPPVLAKALRKIIDNPFVAEEMGKKAKDSYKKHFVPEIHIKRLLEQFKYYIEKKQPHKISKETRYTLKGTNELEKLIEELVNEISVNFKAEVSPNDYRALLLIGGYGKGEGGAELREGRELIHNDMDLLLITTNDSLADQSRLQKTLERISNSIGKKHDVRIVSSVISDKKLRNSPSLIIWHDMYYGHKLLAGEHDYVSTLPFSNAAKIPPEDVLTLLVNRGTLLVINDLLMSMNEDSSETHRKMITKHIMKAIIGFGDAYLYFQGKYHWSYRERQLRMKSCIDCPEEFQQLYDQASSFRFQPEYNNFQSTDLKERMNKVKEILSSIYLECEKKRLKNPNLNWENYYDLFLRHISRCTGKSILRKLKGLFNIPKVFIGTSYMAKFHFWMLSPKERLAFVFPAIAFGKVNKEILVQISNFLSSFEVASHNSLQSAYLHQWGIYYDKNFFNLLKTLSISLEKPIHQPTKRLEVSK